ncbi:MAG: hypothetical protein KGZ83_18155 [Sulfuricella sp.]|nr:hypothetical protein [Sulfuricella sp.]
MRSSTPASSAPPSLKQSAERFLSSHPRFGGWRHEYVAIAPEISPELRESLLESGVVPESLRDLIQGL